MTKKVRVENADTSDFKVVVQVWNKSYNGEGPDTLEKEIRLDFPCATTGDECYLTSHRYLIVKEVPSA